ncbi:hypothetical protein MPER_03459, partial [Moniliophthora perniciosa FA553]
MTTPADPIRQALVSVINPKDHSSWDEAWKQSITPWDTGHAQPGLVSCIESGNVPLKGRALVPGCGAGYDPIYLASVGFDVVGLDISETALAKATALMRVSVKGLRGNVTFKYGNFFELAPANDDEKFDLIYDYT